MIRRPTRADLLGLSFGAVTLGLNAAFGVSEITLGLPTAAVLALFADGVFRPSSGVLLPVIGRGPRNRRRVALTFDDGPDPEHTPRIAEALAKANARATFFCIGRHVEAHSDLARQLVRCGHELGNHSFAHARTLNFRGPRAMKREIDAGAAIIRSVGAGARPLYRPPIGLKSGPLASIASRHGLRVVGWSIRGWDTAPGITPDRITSRVTSRVRPGDIILLHDGCDRPGADRRATVAAMPKILTALRERRLAAVTVSELIAPLDGATTRSTRSEPS